MFGFGYRFGSFGGGLNGAPDNTVAPVATADFLTVGGVLTTTNGTWTGSGITFTYQWYRGASPISGATANTYTLVAADMYNNIYCQVTATNISGSAQANSNSLFAFENLLDIYGANAYDWWDYTDDATLTKSGARIDAAASKVTGSTRAMVSSGSARPQVVTNQVNGLQVARFDGISEFMDVAASTGLYNFLHNATGGVVIKVFKPDVDAATYRILNNRGGTSADLDVNSGFAIAKRNDAAINQSVWNTAPTGAVITNVTAANSFNAQFHSLITVFDSSNATLGDRGIVVIDGGGQIKNNSLNATLSNTDAAYNMTLGRRVRLNDQYFDGKLAEIFIAQNQPTSGQLTRTENYLTYKYGTFPI